MNQDFSRLKSIFENAPIGIFQTSHSGKFIDLNSEFIKILGYQSKDEVFSSIKDLAHDLYVNPKDREKVLAEIRDKDDISVFEVKFKKKNKELIDVRMSIRSILNEETNELNNIGIIEDITELKKTQEKKNVAEAKLKESEEKYRILFENDVIGRIRTDLEGNILLVNKKLLELTEYDTEESFSKRGKIGSGFILVDYNRKEALANLSKFGINKTITKLKTSTGGELFIRFLSKVTKDADGNFLYFDSTIEDITKEIKLQQELENYKDNLEIRVEERTEEILQLYDELKRSNEKLSDLNEELYNQKNKLVETIKELKKAQEQLIQSEKMASIGVLTAGIAHEINNPINFINSGIQGLEVITSDLILAIQEYSAHCSQCGTFEEKKILNQINRKFEVKSSIEHIPKLIKTIRSGVQRTTEIVKGLRTFSRLDNESKTLANINELIDSALVILQNKIKHRIEVVKNYKDSFIINCYPGKLVQVFLNIIMNSIQAIEEKGVIEITTSVNKDNKTFNIEISDTGSGMPKSIQQRIFDPFFTTKKIGEGTGIGLSIVHGIIESHNGEISVRSRVNLGTTFIIKLPL